MNAVGTHDADRRRANFYRGTMRDPDANAITKDQVANAIVSIMTADSTGGQIDMALASTIAGQVLPSVIKQFAGMAPEQLSSQPAFRSMLQLYISPSATDDRTAAQKRLQAANVTSADFAAASRAADTGLASPLLGRRGADGTERAASGARYDGMGSERLSPVDLQNMASARSAAISLGMPWALNNPELLKLGPSAIKTLHEAGVRRETFERMTSDRVGIRAETAVNFAGWANREKLTPEQTNRLMDRTSDLHESLTRDLPTDERRKVQRELDQALNKYVTGPNTPEARRELEEQRMRHAKTEQQREQVRANTRELEAATQRQSAALVRADAKVEKTAAKDKEAADLFAQDVTSDAGAPAQTKKADAGAVAPNDGGNAKTASVATPPKASAPKPA